MKKLIFLVALVLSIASVFAVETKIGVSSNGVHYTIVPKGSTKANIPPEGFADATEYLIFRFAIQGPYGVPLLDADGNPVLDEKNSPVVVFENRHYQFTKVLRLTTYKGSRTYINAAWGQPHPDGDQYDGNGGIIWTKITEKPAFIYVPDPDGGLKGYFFLEVETPFERGLGLGKALLTVRGHLNIKPEKDRYVIQNGSGTVVGVGIDDPEAAKQAEPATIIPMLCDKLPVWGQVHITRWDGIYSMGNLRSNVKEKIIIKKVK